MEPWRGFMNHAESMKRSSGTPCTSSLASRRLTVGGAGVATLLLGFRDRRRVRKPEAQKIARNGNYRNSVHCRFLQYPAAWRWRGLLQPYDTVTACDLTGYASRSPRRIDRPRARAQPAQCTSDAPPCTDSDTELPTSSLHPLAVMLRAVCLIPFPLVSRVSSRLVFPSDPTHTPLASALTPRCSTRCP